MRVRYVVQFRYLSPNFVVAEVTSFHVGPWLVEVPLNRLRNNGATIQLEPKIMQVLVRLAETPGEVVRKEELIRSVWAETFVTDDVLTRSISELRKALEDDARQPRFIETIPRSGYRLLVTSTAAQSEAAYGSLGLPQTAGPFTAQRPTNKVIAGALAALALTVALAWWMWPDPAPALAGYKQLTSDGERKIGPLAADEGRIYFVARTGKGRALAQVSVHGGEASLIPTSLGEDADLLGVSPDFSELLLFSSSNDTAERPLYALPLPAGSPRPIGNIVASDATWSSDGGQIAFAHERSLYIARRDGSDLRRIIELPSPPFGLSWSPSGEIIRFYLARKNGPGRELWEVSSSGTHLQRLFPRWDGTFSGRAGTWTPDGRWYVFGAFREGRMVVCAVREHGRFWPWPRTEPVQLTSAPANVVLPVFSRDGKKLFVMTGVSRTEVLRYDSSSKRFVRYAAISGISFDFLPNGQSVIYNRMPGFALMRSRLDGSGQTQLVFPPISARLPRLSPDGSRIAFVGMPGDDGIFVVPASGGVPEKVLGGRLSDPDWSPDGTRLVLTAVGMPPAQSHLVLVDLKTHHTEDIPGSEDMASARWSRDGRFIAALQGSIGPLVVFDFVTHSWTRLASSPVASQEWSRDGQYLYFISMRREERVVNRACMRDRKTEFVASLNEVRQDEMPSPFSSIGIAPDGSLVAIRDLTTVDIYSLDWRAR
jgi:DNA-binding winged helix-turn-helix (wHTH) protein/Tol biopolymer transport system component